MGTDFTPDMIRSYLYASGNAATLKTVAALADDEVSVSHISCAVEIIGAYPSDDIRRNPEMVRQAFDSVLDWASDYGCKLLIEDDEIVLEIEATASVS